MYAGKLILNNTKKIYNTDVQNRLSQILHLGTNFRMFCAEAHQKFTPAFWRQCLGVCVLLSVNNVEASSSLNTAPQDFTINFGVSCTNNFIEPTGGASPYAYALDTTTTHGNLSLTADTLGYTYTPNTGYFGTDSFSYVVTDNISSTATDTINITVNAPTIPPTAANLTINSIPFAAPPTPITGTLPQADDGYGNILSMTYALGATGPAAGNTVTLNPDGTYTYMPASGFFGADSFTYTVLNAAGSSSEYTVILTIDGPPPLTIAASANVSIPFGGTYTNTIFATGGIEPYAYSAVASNGMLISSAPNYAYIPSAGFFGTDTITNVVEDSYGNVSTYSFSITVNAPTTPPTAADLAITPIPFAEPPTPINGTLPQADDGYGNILSMTYALGATSPTSGDVTINSDGTYTHTPASGFFGADSFTYTVLNAAGIASPEYTVTLTIDAPTIPPTAENLTINPISFAAPPTPINGTLTANDGYGGVLPMTYALGNSPVNGEVVLDPATGNYTYRSYSGFFGADSFTYTVLNAAGSSSEYIVTLMINAPTIPPTAADLTIAVQPNTSFTGALPAASDGYGNIFSITYEGTQSPQHTSTFILNPDGTFSYAPTADFLGTDSFRYKVRDVVGDSVEYIVNLTINYLPVVFTGALEISDPATNFHFPGSRYDQYTFTAPSTGSYEFRTSPPGFDTVLYLFSNLFSPANTNTNRLSMNDDGAGSLNSLITHALTAGTTYIAVITNYSNQFGSYTLTITPPPFDFAGENATLTETDFNIFPSLISTSGTPDVTINLTTENKTIPKILSSIRNVIKNGSKKLTLTGTSTYTGTTSINAGILAGNISNSSSVVVTGTYDLNGTARTVKNLSGSGVIKSSSTNAALIVNVSAQSNFSGILESTINGLTKTGIETLILSGANTYLGTTNISAGTLVGNISKALTLAAPQYFQTSEVILLNLENIAAQPWTTYAYNYTATEAQSYIRFKLRQDPSWEYLDTISVKVQGNQTNLLTNGDFETGNLSGWIQGAVAGWNGGSGSVVFGGANTGNYRYRAWNRSLFQSFTTTPGQNYTFSFAFENDGGTPQQFIASMGGRAISTPTYYYLGSRHQTLNTLIGAAGSVIGLQQDSFTTTARALTLNNTSPLVIASNLIGAGCLILDGTSSVTLSGTSTYSGGTTIKSGNTLKISSANNIGTGTLTLQGGVLQALASFELNQTLSLASASSSIDPNGYDLILSGLITGTAGSKLTITAPNGGTIIYAGSSQIIRSGNIFTIPTPAPVLLSSTSNTIDDTALQTVADITAASGTPDVTFSMTTNPTVYGNISYPIKDVTVSGDMTLKGENTYTGETKVENGAALAISKPKNIGSGSLVFKAGTKLRITQCSSFFNQARAPRPKVFQDLQLC